MRHLRLTLFLALTIVSCVPTKQNSKSFQNEASNPRPAKMDANVCVPFLLAEGTNIDPCALAFLTGWGWGLHAGTNRNGEIEVFPTVPIDIHMERMTRLLGLNIESRVFIQQQDLYQVITSAITQAQQVIRGRVLVLIAGHILEVTQAAPGSGGFYFLDPGLNPSVDPRSMPVAAPPQWGKGVERFISISELQNFSVYFVYVISGEPVKSIGVTEDQIRDIASTISGSTGFSGHLSNETFGVASWERIQADPAILCTGYNGVSIALALNFNAACVSKALRSTQIFLPKSVDVAALNKTVDLEIDFLSMILGHIESGCSNVGELAMLAESMADLQVAKMRDLSAKASNATIGPNSTAKPKVLGTPQPPNRSLR